MNKSKREFLEEYSNTPELAAKVFNQMSASWSEIKESPSDYRDAGAGVGGFIYYDNTVPFAKKNLVLIMDALNEFEQELGEPLNKQTDDETAFYNWHAWFALEHVIDQVMSYLEN